MGSIQVNNEYSCIVGLIYRIIALIHFLFIQISLFLYLDCKEFELQFFSVTYSLQCITKAVQRGYTVLVCFVKALPVDILFSGVKPF